MNTMFRFLRRTAALAAAVLCLAGSTGTAQASETAGESADTLAAVYRAEAPALSEENAMALLASLGREASGRTEKENYGLKSLSFDCGDGYTLRLESLEEDGTYGLYTRLTYTNREKYAKYGDYPIYSGEDSYRTNAYYTLGWMFTREEDFAFASAEEAEADIRAALETLGVQDLTLLRILRVDHEAMAEAVQIVTTEERFAPIVGDAENNGYQLREDWSEADDAYCFSFTVAPGGIPMCYRQEATEDGGFYSGTEIIAWYTCDGIIFLDVNYPWQVGEEKQAPAEILSEEAAEEIALAEFPLREPTFEGTLESLTLEYRYTEEDGESLLTPVWEAAFSFTPDGLDSPVYHFLVLDAFTGEVLVLSN